MYCIPSALAYLDAVHLVEGPAVLLVVFGVPEVPAEVVEDAKVVAREAVRHEVVVEVAVPRDGQRHHAALDGHPEQNTEFPIPSCERFRHVLFWDTHFGECLLFFGLESVFRRATKLSLAQLPKTYPKHIYGRWDGKLCTVLDGILDGLTK